jgi:hypothetical protein
LADLQIRDLRAALRTFATVDQRAAIWQLPRYSELPSPTMSHWSKSGPHGLWWYGPFPVRSFLKDHLHCMTKTDVRIIDFVDTGHPALLRMWEKRQAGYKVMGYRIAEGAMKQSGN